MTLVLTLKQRKALEGLLKECPPPPDGTPEDWGQSFIFEAAHGGLVQGGQFADGVTKEPVNW